MSDDMVPVPRNTLTYAMTALDASSDNGDRYCAQQIREALFPGLRELLEERAELRRELKGRIFHLVYNVSGTGAQEASQTMAEFQAETDRLRCELTGENPEELAERRAQNSQGFRVRVSKAFEEYAATQRDKRLWSRAKAMYERFTPLGTPAWEDLSEAERVRQRAAVEYQEKMEADLAAHPIQAENILPGTIDPDKIRTEKGYTLIGFNEAAASERLAAALDDQERDQ